MGLETGTFISDLDAANPVGATDQKSQGDDHLRLIKSTILASFPGITGAMSKTHTELNNAAILTDALNAFLAITATTYDGIAAADLVDKSATELISGNWTHTGSLIISDGADVLNFSATAGTVLAQPTGGMGLMDFNINVDVLDLTAQSYEGILATNILGEITNIDVSVINSNALQPGYKGAPQRTTAASESLVLTDCGRQIYLTGGAGQTLTIPANGAVAFPVGTIIEVVNDAANSWSIAITTDTLEELGTGNTGTRTLADNNKAILEKVTATLWKYSATG